MIELDCADFHEIKNKEELEEILTPIINEFVRQGYRNVPDCYELAERMREVVICVSS